MVKASPSQPRCYIDSTPPEVISEILRFACDATGDAEVSPKWGFPSVANRLSRRFYRITMDTHSLWRYIYVSEAPYHFNHIRARIARPHNLTLIADVSCYAECFTKRDGETDNEGENWRELLKIVVPILPRLSTLVFRSPFSAIPIHVLFRHNMHVLESLHIHGTREENGGALIYNLPPTQFPVLRTLRSSEFLHWQRGKKLPATVEELYLGRTSYTMPFEGFWDFLPTNLRVLKVKRHRWYEVTPPRDGKPRLPCLTELDFVECDGPDVLNIIQNMEGSSLKKLSISVMDATNDEMRSLSFTLELPNLTHFIWGSRCELPPTADYLRQCPALASVHLDTFGPLESVSEFVNALASDPTLLPSLEDLKVLGTSIFSLRKVVQAHPLLKRLEVHVSELGLRPLATKKEFRHWEECMVWLDRHVVVVANRLGCTGVRFNYSEFYRDNLPRYRSWEDMMAGRTVDMPDWKRIEEADRDFWRDRPHIG